MNYFLHYNLNMDNYILFTFYFIEFYFILIHFKEKIEKRKEKNHK